MGLLKPQGYRPATQSSGGSEELIPTQPTRPGLLRPRTQETDVSVASARSRPNTNGSHGVMGESFATANEDWEAEFRRRRMEGQESIVSGAKDSLASLLRRDRDARREAEILAEGGGPSGQERRGSLWGWKKQRTIEDPLEPGHPGRVEGGLVRFNTDDGGVRNRDDKVKKKMEGLSRARSLRRGLQHRRSSGSQNSGEIIKMESMIVRIETARAQLPDDYDENASLKVDTRTADKWREYVVVCREREDPEAPLMLRLYKNRRIPAVDKKSFSGRSREIPLNAKTTKVNLYSSLDKTLVIWLPHHHGTIIYIMRPRCSSSSVEWYTFLCTALGEKQAKTLEIKVPDLSLTISLSNPFDRRDKTEEDEDGCITVIQPQFVAESLLKRSVGLLEDVSEWSSVLNHWKESQRMGLAWRRYDRLEWIHGVNERLMDGSMAMVKTHELELRPKTHYPTETTIKGKGKMIEPPPVEGYLVRLTSRGGREERMGRNFQKRLYFSTFDQFLCFCKPSVATPPQPPKKYTTPSTTPSEPGTPQPPTETPLIYSVTPYSLTSSGTISWLSPPTNPQLAAQRDDAAYAEAQRNISVLSAADGYIDLTTCILCRPCDATSSPIPPEALAPRERDTNDTFDPTWPDGDPVSLYSFELLLNNGLSVKLQAYNLASRNEWIRRLSDLIVYWSSRHNNDLITIRVTRDENCKSLGIDEETESLLGQLGKKWEVSSSLTLASAEIYNVCPLSSCRTITMSGLLYRKPRRNATFKRYEVILCNGCLIIFHHTARAATGKEKRTTYHEKHLVIKLRDAYVYSGVVTEEEMTGVPGRKMTPRIWGDGFTSQDAGGVTTFVVWAAVGKGGPGKKGKATVFKARSRVERDAWVSNIAMEIERLNVGREEDVKIVEGKKK